MVTLSDKESYHIVVIGCGGTGSQLLPSLFQLASNTNRIESITLVDGDHFEPKNCANQKCLIEEAGDNKATALATRFSYIYPNLNINSYPYYIKNVDDLLSLTRYYSSTIYIGCVDNNSTRKLISECFNIVGKSTSFKSAIYIDAGNGDINRSGQVIVGCYNNGEKVTKSVTDLFPEVLNEDEDLQNITSCTRISSEHPQNIATNILSANIIFATLTNIIMFDKIEKSIIYFDVDKIVVSSR